MPFDYKEYEKRLSHMSPRDLRAEIQHQSDNIVGASAGTGFAILAVPLTMGISAVAIGGTAPAIINARKKRSIAKKHLESRTSIDAGSSSSSAQASGVKRGPAPKSQQSLSTDEELPLYTPRADMPDTREKQVFVPVEETEDESPPTYDQATIKRMATIRQGHSAMSHEDTWSTMEHEPLSSAASSVHSTERPRTPSVRSVEPPVDLLGREASQTQQAKFDQAVTPVIADDMKGSEGLHRS